MGEKLNAKQEKFVKLYLVDLNATKAAIGAGYSARTAAVQGSRLLTNAKIKAAIDEAIERRNKRLEIDQDRILQTLAKIAFADIKDYLSYRTDLVPAGTTEDGTVVVERRQVIEMKPSEEVDGTLISKVSIDRRGRFTFELVGKERALEMLARHVGILKEPEPKVEINLNLAERMRAGRERVAGGEGGASGDAGGTTAN